MSLQEYKNFESKELLGQAAAMQKEGYRLIQLSCSAIEGKYEITYSFAKEDVTDFKNIRMVIAGDEVIPSITSLYPYAYLYENELHDLFDLSVEGINVDFKGNLYQTAVKAPFKA